MFFYYGSVTMIYERQKEIENYRRRLQQGIGI